MLVLLSEGLDDTKGTHEDDCCCNWRQPRRRKRDRTRSRRCRRNRLCHGRSVAGGDSPYGGTVAETVQLITEAGGKGIAVAVDHAVDQALSALVDRIKHELGKLDILVNNAANLIATTTDAGGLLGKALRNCGIADCRPALAFRGKL
jgi:NAD(P)-dependent dehydrogenase (short-subunit alcohol dehydrogenase family)